MAWILVVDDHVDTAKVLARLLIKNGHMAECAHDGEQAIVRAKSERAPDLMILDFMMPGMDGLEVLRRLKASPATARIKVVLYTAVNDEFFRQSCLERGAEDCWSKGGITYDQISRRIGELISVAKQPTALGPNPAHASDTRTGKSREAKQCCRRQWYSHRLTQ